MKKYQFLMVHGTHPTLATDDSFDNQRVFF
jgi:hypothetical protein